MAINENARSLTGFGETNAKEVEELTKALSISQNYGTDAANTITGGTALQVEDLSSTLKIVTHGMDHLSIWKDIIKNDASNTVHEFNVQNSYGQSTSPFFQMGGTPEGTDANYERDIVRVKYLGTQGAVQHDLTLVKAAHGPVVAREVKNKTIELLSKNEFAMRDGDSSISALEYDGIDAQIMNKEQESRYKSDTFQGYATIADSESVVLDAKGSQLTETLAEDMALTCVNNFGLA